MIVQPRTFVSPVIKSGGVAVLPTSHVDNCINIPTPEPHTALAELGVIEVSELADITDDELAAVGMTHIHIKRLRRQVPSGGGLRRTLVKPYIVFI